MNNTYDNSHRNFIHSEGRPCRCVTGIPKGEYYLQKKHFFTTLTNEIVLRSVDKRMWQTCTCTIFWTQNEKPQNLCMTMIYEHVWLVWL